MKTRVSHAGRFETLILDSSAAARLIFLRVQVRALKRRERGLLFLLGKTCDGNRAEAEVELVRVHRHVEQAEEELRAFIQLKGLEDLPVGLRAR